MSVNPGFGGQNFIPESIQKVSALADYRTEYSLSFLIEVDGGVNLDNGKLLASAGADALVAGSFVFNADSPSDTISALKNL
jgi:ribulose-phosphate 3-epimerase